MTALRYLCLFVTLLLVVPICVHIFNVYLDCRDINVSPASVGDGPKNELAQDIPRILYTSSAHAHGRYLQTVMSGFKHVVLDDGYPFIAKHCGHRAADAYNQLKPKAFKADLLRYCLLWATGGVWADDDLVFLLPLEKIVPAKTFFDVLLPIDTPVCGHRGARNAFIAAVPRSSVFKCAMNAIISNVNAKRYIFHGRSLALHVTGPALLFDCAAGGSVSYMWDWRHQSTLNDKDAMYANGAEAIVHVGRTGPRESYGKMMTWRKVYK